MMSRYKSNGKLLLTGEYLVLQGAIALALPLKIGQSLDVNVLATNNNIIHWDAYSPKGLWFSSMLNKHDFSVRGSDNVEMAFMLSKIFKAVKKQNDCILNERGDYDFVTRLDFEPEWGLGSSSTLITNMAMWADIDPYKLLRDTFGGSGYDIACAKASKPILYYLESGEAHYREIDFNPPFADNLYFVYRGHKQKTSVEVSYFKEKLMSNDFGDDIYTVSELSLSLPNICELKDFCSFMDIHEAIMSNCLERPAIKTLFPDFNGTLKSLGAWGGDFFLAATELSHDEVFSYFHKKGFDVILRYNDVVRNPA